MIFPVAKIQLCFESNKNEENLFLMCRNFLMFHKQKAFKPVQAECQQACSICQGAANFSQIQKKMKCLVKKSLPLPL